MVLCYFVIIHKIREEVKKMPGKTMLEQIQETEDGRSLAAIYYTCKAKVLSRTMKGKEYGECTLALSKKLGFGVTDKSMESFCATLGA